MLWYLPTFYGDIQCVRTGKKTIVSWKHLTETERKALERLVGLGAKKGWIPSDTAAPVPPGRQHDDGSLVFEAKLETVQRTLIKELKPKRDIVEMVRFTNGKIEEVIGEKEAPAAAVGASVAKPVQGCPEPRLMAAELRARAVLNAFLDAEQREDFHNRNAFLSVGAGTGHRYIVTSRHAVDQLAKRRRQLYDLDEARPYCVHDYSVPPAEEMLAIHLMLQAPEHERYLRHLE